MEIYRYVFMTTPRVPLTQQLAYQLGQSCERLGRVTCATGDYKSEKARFGNLVIATHGVAGDWFWKE